MTNVFPNSNLPTVCQPWGREIQKRVTNLESQFSLQRTNAATIDAQLQASYRRIDNTLNGIIGLGASGSGYTINADNINGGTITGVNFNTSGGTESLTLSSGKINFFEGSSAIGSITADTDGTNDYIQIQSLSNDGSLTIGSDYAVLSGSNASVQVGSFDPGRVTFNGNLVRCQTDLKVTDEIDADGNIFGATLTAKSNGAISGGSLYTSGQVNADGNLFGASVTAKDGGGLFGGSLSVSGVASSGSVSTGSISTSSSITSGGNIRAPGITSTTFLQAENHAGGGTTGASINTNGTIIRTSSSQRYKQDIEDLTINYQDLLSLQPKRFKLKDEAAEDSNARYYAGFIAEEIDQTSLKDFVAYRTIEDGSVVPDGVYYGELTAALLEAIKHQDSIIKSLTNRLEILENDKV
jgi:hypothetical protein